MFRLIMAIVMFLQRLRRDGNYDEPEFVQPQEETLMSIVWN